MDRFCPGYVGYDDATAAELCVDNEDVDIRKGCLSDDECLTNGKTICDTDPKCFGIAWYQPRMAQRLKICRSTRMKPKYDGWRTLMKQGDYTLSLSLTIQV